MQLCDVLAYLHSQNIIFRDLKPGNIMLTKDNRIKLIDFGIVRFFNPKKTKDTQAIGTPGYFGPEALHGQTDARSDIYSLSVTLHQLVTGYDPGTSVFHIPAARTINPRVSQEMERILLRGHQTDRNQRWTSMNEMRAAFSLLSKAYSAGGSSSSYINNNLGPTVSTQGAIKTSRPTQKLILAASQLSTNQLMLLSGGLVLTIVIATWVLTPILNSIRIDWNIVPLTALFGAFGYAALPRRGSAAGAHILLGGALTLTINVRLGWTGTYTGPDLFWGLVVSGLAMEVWVTFLNRIKGRNLDEAWKREIGWLAAMATLGTIILFGLLFDGLYFRNILQWIMAGLLGAAGWFLGDLIQQTILYRRTGFRQLP
jgi:hypothetical protein